MAGEDRAGEVVEASPTGVALVTLPVRLGVVPPVLGHRGRGAMGAGDPVGPAHRPDRLVALGVVDQVLDVHHRSILRSRGTMRSQSAAGTTAGTDCNDEVARLAHHPAIHLEPSELSFDEATSRLGLDHLTVTLLDS